MFDVIANNKQKTLQQLNELFFSKLDAADAQAVSQFAEQYYLVAPAEELAGQRMEMLYGATLAAWQSLQVVDPSSPKIRVFNPDVEQHGWHSTHTVIEIINQDMPFLVDSIRMALSRQEIALHALHNTVLAVHRDASHQLLSLVPVGGDEQGAQQESLICLEVDRHSDPEALRALRQALLDVLESVKAAVTDFSAMHDRLRVLQALRVPEEADQALWQESQAFLGWLAEEHFTFLGYECREVIAGESRLLPDSALGLCRLQPGEPALIVGQAPSALLHFSRDVRRSPVRRDAYQDIVACYEVDPSGQVVREHRFYGLYTSPVYSDLPSRIPLVRRKVEAVLRQAGFSARGHSGRELMQVLHELPREELFLSSSSELFQLALGVFNLQKRRKVKLFTRCDAGGAFVSCLYFVPRDLYSTALRLRVQKILSEAFSATDVEFETRFSDSTLARTGFLLRVDANQGRTPDLAAVAALVAEASRCWDEDLHGALVESCGEERGNRFANLYRGAFPSAYREHFAPGHAVYDIQYLDRLENGAPLAMSIYRLLEEPSDWLRFKLFTREASLILSDVIPVLENLGMQVVGEHPYELRRRDGQVFWMHDFTLTAKGVESVDLQEVRDIFQEAFASVWEGLSENDPFNRLVIGANLNWREVSVLRAYARYSRQIRFGFSQTYIAAALNRHRQLSRLLVALFKARFDPARQASNKAQALAERIEQSILDGLERVESLNDDKVVRRMLELIKATLRTNFYQRAEQEGGAHAAPKAYLSFKIDPHQIARMPLPRPRYEVFVYSPRVEGVHLRGGKVARGGLRWSDRREDYRTEVLGLVKAQQVKNAVIVPVGAKGGFVAKQLPDRSSREAVQAEGVACYQTFIRGLLDLTDNLVNGEVQPPRDVVRYDDADPYLVVAADKGTATFSDIANEIAARYGFWLGDAFASGGSQGYDHKGMGITARGAWESVKRHFRERGVNTQREPFSVVAIGDMAGDVFGNGMLLSDQIRLVAAFNHQHIFIDPCPDVGRSFAERKRLFELPRSSWADYDTRLISEGGGVFSRQAKWIDLTPQIQRCLQIRESRLSPTELITALLKAPVDLLWNGGIGTYVKASSETHAEVGDKANDGLRVNGNELRCKVVGEGGNLGLTQLGRIEFARQGGAICTDFIDNAGGVDCSDHEVNIKILLNELVANGDLTLKQRNALLKEMTEQVAGLVLQNNYRQTQALSLAEAHARVALDEYIRLIQSLEASGKLNRALEFLPDDEQLSERKSQEVGLTRPELSVLISYTKAELKQALIDTRVSEDPVLAGVVESAFPQMLVERFPEAVHQHRLRREIIATQLANSLVNQLGITFVHRLKQATGAELPEIVAASVAVREIFDLDTIWRQIEALDYQVDAQVQASMMADLIRLVRRATHWFLSSRHAQIDVGQLVTQFRPGVEALSRSNGELRCWAIEHHGGEKAQQLQDAGVPAALAMLVAGAESLYSLLGMIRVAECTEAALPAVASVYTEVGAVLELGWFDQQIRSIPADSHWQSLARDCFRDDLELQQQALTVNVLRSQGGETGEDTGALVAQWLARNAAGLRRWNLMLSELRGHGSGDSAIVAVAIRELAALAQGGLQPG